MTKRLIIAMCGILVLSLIIAITTIPQSPVFIGLETSDTTATTTTATSTTVKIVEVAETIETTEVTESITTTVPSSTTKNAEEKTLNATTLTSTKVETTAPKTTTQVTTKHSTTKIETTTVTPKTFGSPTAAEFEALELINAERTKAGLHTLTFSYRLYDCAKMRAVETTIHLSHTRPNGTKFNTILNDYNIAHKKCIGENIAYNYRYVSSAINVLMGSETHKENILSPQYTSVAIGVAQLDNGNYTMVQLFEG